MQRVASNLVFVHCQSNSLTSSKEIPERYLALAFCNRLKACQNKWFGVDTTLWVYQIAVRSSRSWCV